MDRYNMINVVGTSFLVSNIENGEFSYEAALKDKGKNYRDFLSSDALRAYKNLDLRFVDGRLSVLIETKPVLSTISKHRNDITQLKNYIRLEKELTGNHVVAILAATKSDDLYVWQDSPTEISSENFDKNERVLKSMQEYKSMYFGNRNDKIKILQNTYHLNELLHQNGINEKIRSQFVGTCLLALKNGLQYDSKFFYSPAQIITGIESILQKLLNNDLNKAEKLVILKNKVLESQDVRHLSVQDFEIILNSINDNILPYINDKNTVGQDLLNLFFTTFNKYVGKSDKNQAFTPDHIAQFMCKVLNINRNSVVLDPCCGSGAFLVRALTMAMDDCDTKEQRERVKCSHIYGIEFEETAFGLATTNMLIHGDGNSNIINGSCFEKLDKILEKIQNTNGLPSINSVLMNPPYNAQKKHSESNYAKSWSNKVKEDPSKGLHFVYEVAKKVKTGKLAVLLPMQCAISDNNSIKIFKQKMLEEHTLDAVFSLPNDIFHPGASAVACCMVFNLGVRHGTSPNKKTFFGYFKEDGFQKRKNLGRVEAFEGSWYSHESKWLDLYFNRREEIGLSVTHEVTAEDEWVAEAYMQTNYENLTMQHFQDVVNKYAGFLLSNGKIEVTRDIINTLNHHPENSQTPSIETSNWKVFQFPEIFHIRKGFYNKKPVKDEDGDIPFLGATDKNNGVTEYYLYEDIESASKNGNGDRNADINEKLFKPFAVCVTNNGSVGYAYYQNESFTCSHDVNPLYRKDGDFNVYTGLFVATVIMLDRYRWQYGRKWRPKRMKESVIMLPSDNNGRPDWEYMERYIKSLSNASLLQI